MTLGALGLLLGCSWAALALLLGPLGTLLVSPWSTLGRSWVTLGPSSTTLGHPKGSEIVHNTIRELFVGTAGSILFHFGTPQEADLMRIDVTST